MRYLVLCKTAEGEILDWTELHKEPSDNAAVMSAFAFGTQVEDTDVIEIHAASDTVTQMICQILV